MSNLYETIIDEWVDGKSAFRLVIDDRGDWAVHYREGDFWIWESDYHWGPILCARIKQLNEHKRGSG